MNRARRKKSPPRHRLIPVWNKSLDREAFARALLLLAIHLETKQAAREKSRTPETNSSKTDMKGGGHDEEQPS